MPPILTQLAVGHIAMVVSLPFLFITSLIMRMPYSLKTQIEGVKMTGVNKSFIEIDR